MSANLNYFPCRDTADTFYIYFINIVDNVLNVADDSNFATDFRTYLDPSSVYSMHVFPCNKIEIKGYINSLKLNCAGYSEITSALPN